MFDEKKGILDKKEVPIQQNVVIPKNGNIDPEHFSISFQELLADLRQELSSLS